MCRVLLWKWDGIYDWILASVKRPVVAIAKYGTPSAGTSGGGGGGGDREGPSVLLVLSLGRHGLCTTHFRALPIPEQVPTHEKSALKSKSILAGRRSYRYLGRLVADLVKSHLGRLGGFTGQVRQRSPLGQSMHTKLPKRRRSRSADTAQEGRPFLSSRGSTMSRAETQSSGVPLSLRLLPLQGNTPASSKAESVRSNSGSTGAETTTDSLSLSDTEPPGPDGISRLTRDLLGRAFRADMSLGALAFDRGNTVSHFPCLYCKDS